MPPIIAALIRSTLCLHQSLLLIHISRMLTPLRRLVLAALLLLIALLFRLVHGLRVVLGGRVDRDELERLGLGGVDELVLGAGGDDDDVGLLDVLERRLSVTCAVSSTEVYAVPAPCPPR